MSNKPLIREHCGYLLNVLNEVLNGFRVDFGTAPETSRDNISRLYEKISGSECSEISSEDARLLLNCAILCRREFSESEFETRLGESVSDATKLDQALKLLAGAV